MKAAYAEGDEQDLIVWGGFRFRMGDEEWAFQAGKSDPLEGRLFIPFRDVTSGADKYGAG